jgi:DNA polymerase-3 subunit alpha
MQIAQELSGFTASEADILRRAVGKKKKTELEKQKQNFIEGASKNGISKEIAAGIFLKIEPFAKYGFNKSHAAAYAIIAYQTAFLKAHYPHEFFVASMSMELSNQNKLSEFHEELKRLDINIIRPDINNCYADFKSDGKIFYYALGALKNVGFDAISNLVNERIKNGSFISLKDFIKRVNPKDINKLQLEGLVKAGAFDKLNDNRQSIYNSIPNIILHSKNIFANKLANQNDLFNNEEDKNDIILEEIKDWKFEERLSKEFQTLGFFMSDHPLNQFKNLYDEFKIKNYSEFNHINEAIEVNIASTVLKIQEKKTQKGNSYAIVKFSDLSSVFELFIFSDIFEMNRNILVEGNSLILTLSKNLSDDDNKFKRINVKKIASLNDLIDMPLNEVKIFLENIEQLKKIDNIFKTNGKTDVIIFIKNNNQNLSFKFKTMKNIERKSLETLKNKGISLIIN